MPSKQALSGWSKGALSLAGGLLLTMAGAGLASPRPAHHKTSAHAAPLLVYVGMHGTDIRMGRFDPATGSLTIDKTVAQLDRPTWTLAHPLLPVLYAVNEIGNDGKTNGSVQAFRIDRKNGALTKIGDVDAGGGGTTYLTYDPRSHTLFAANYGGGSVATIPVRADGSLGARSSLVQDVGTGPNRRQASPHAHGAQIDPSGRFVLVSDLGADRMFVYPFEAKSHSLSLPVQGQEHHYAAPAGSGPRHTAFSPDGRHLYLLNELTAELMSFRWEAATGTPVEIEHRSTNSPGFSGMSSTSEIAISPNGRYLYVGNRAEHCVVVYALDRTSGKPTEVQRIGGGGDVPWSFTFDPSHRWLLLANEKSNAIAVFSVDTASGKLHDTGQRVSTPSPVSITFTRGQ